MSLRELLTDLTKLSLMDGVDLDEEVVIEHCNKLGDHIQDLDLYDADWLWKDIVDEENGTKIILLKAIER